MSEKVEYNLPCSAQSRVRKNRATSTWSCRTSTLLRIKKRLGGSPSIITSDKGLKMLWWKITRSEPIIEKKIISNSDLKEHFQKDGPDFLQSPQIDDPWKTSLDYQGCKSQAWQTRPSQTSQDFQVDWSGPFRPEISGELGRADDLQPYCQ